MADRLSYFPDIALANLDSMTWIDSRVFSDLASGLESLSGSNKEVWLTESATLSGDLASGTCTGIDLVVRKGVTLTLNGITTIDFNLRVEDGGQVLLDQDCTVNGNIESKGNTAGVVAFDAVDGDETLTINGSIEAGLWQVFGDNLRDNIDGSPNIDQGYPEWFGAVGDGTTDDSGAFSAILNSPISNVLLSDKTYYIPSRVEIYNSVYLIGQSGAEILGADTTQVGIFNFRKPFSLENIKFSTALNLVNMGYITDYGDVSIKECEFTDCMRGVLGRFETTYVDMGKLTFKDNYVYDCELGLDTKYVMWDTVNVSDNFFKDLYLLSLSSRPTTGDKDKSAHYYVGGAFIQANSTALSNGTVSSHLIGKGNVGIDIINQNVDPYTGDNLGENEETSMIQFRGREILLSNNTASNCYKKVVTGSSDSDDEVLLARGDNILISDNLFYNCGSKEGTINCKASYKIKVSDNTLYRTSTFESQFGDETAGIRVAGPSVIDGNWIENISQAVVVRGENPIISNNFFDAIRDGIFYDSFEAKRDYINIVDNKATNVDRFFFFMKEYTTGFDWEDAFYHVKISGNNVEGSCSRLAGTKLKGFETLHITDNKLTTTNSDQYAGAVRITGGSLSTSSVKDTIIIANNQFNFEDRGRIVWMDLDDSDYPVDNLLIENNIVKGGDFGFYLGSFATVNILDTMVLQNNIIKDNASAPVFYEGDFVTNSTTLKVKNNEGYVTENSGTVTISSNTKVSHGLVRTPHLIFLSCKNSFASAYAIYPNNTEFEVRFSEGGDKTFYWYAEAPC